MKIYKKIIGAYLLIATSLMVVGMIQYAFDVENKAALLIGLGMFMAAGFFFLFWSLIEFMFEKDENL